MSDTYESFDIEPTVAERTIQYIIKIHPCLSLVMLLINILMCGFVIGIFKMTLDDCVLS